MNYLPPSRENVNPLTHFLRKRGRNPVQLAASLLMTPWFSLRYRRFWAFFDARMKLSEKQYTRSMLEREELPYDALFFESDVIWSPGYFGGSFDPVYFGAMAPMRNKKKIVYSASMSEAKLKERHYDELRALLAYPDRISMRERYASEIIRRLTDKPVADVIDPVLLADPADFDEITAPRRVRKPYLLMYFPVRPDASVRRDAAKYARARGLKLVEVSAFAWHKLYNKTFSAAGIEDFVSLVRNADAVFCNSLHGTCLSLLFHRDFYAFDHGGGGGRKYLDLCGKFGLEDRFVREGSFREAAPIDWSAVDRTREALRAESLAWLDEAITWAQGG